MDSKWIEIRNRVIFDADAKTFAAVAARESEALAAEKDARLLADITVDMQSYLMHYVPGNEKGALDAAAAAQAQKNIAALQSMGENALADEVRAQIAALKDSNLIRLTQAADAGELNVRWGNDNGLGLMNAMRRGAVMVTTNPPIVNMARKAQPAFYDAVRDRINAEHPDEPVERRISRLTMAVVLNNCWALRRIFERSNHELGYVCYQVNPEKYQDAAAMAEEILFAYGEMEKALGGKPNVAFKVPGTKAALAAVETVAAKGVVVTITVNFSAAQSYEFAKRIQAGCAEKSYVVMMSGRLDGPVEDDLKAAGVENAGLVARNASRAVTRKVYYDVLCNNHFDKTEILVASLRGAWNFDASLTKDPQSRIMISSFPDKWEDYESAPRSLTPLVQQPVSEAEIAVLEKSDVFHKAYHFDALTPDEYDTYKPVLATLTQFIGVYGELKDYMGK